MSAHAEKYRFMNGRATVWSRRITLILWAASRPYPSIWNYILIRVHILSVCVPCHPLTQRIHNRDAIIPCKHVLSCNVGARFVLGTCSFKAFMSQQNGCHLFKTKHAVVDPQAVYKQHIILCSNVKVLKCETESLHGLNAFMFVSVGQSRTNSATLTPTEGSDYIYRDMLGLISVKHTKITFKLKKNRMFRTPG